MTKPFCEMYGDVKSPYSNDPFVAICKAVCRLYPNTKITEIRYADLGGDGYGFTDFLDDGDVVINIDASLSIENAAEIFAHEISHAVVGLEHEHDETWEDAFEKIHKEYEKMIEEMTNNDIHKSPG